MHRRWFLGFRGPVFHQNGVPQIHHRAHPTILDRTQSWVERWGHTWVRLGRSSVAAAASNLVGTEHLKLVAAGTLDFAQMRRCRRCTAVVGRIAAAGRIEVAGRSSPRVLVGCWHRIDRTVVPARRAGSRPEMGPQLT